MKKFVLLLLNIIIIVSILVACTSAGTGQESVAPASTEPETSGAPPSTEPEASLVPAKGKIILSTTTSTEDSGLLAYILPVFTEETGWEVDTIAVGTGAAIQMGRDGEADVLLVHSRPDEDKFVEEGFAVARYDVMYNDYVIVGPAGGEITYNEDVDATFTSILNSSLPFVSRGDDSGTHKKELSIWNGLGFDPTTNSAYVSAGQGMGATLGMAAEMGAYTLADRATWLTYDDKAGLEIVCEKSAGLLNPYGVIPVSASVGEHINTEGGQAFADWIISGTTQELISTFGVEEFGQPLFIPNAK